MMQNRFTSEHSEETLKQMGVLEKVSQDLKESECDTLEFDDEVAEKALSIIERFLRIFKLV